MKVLICTNNSLRYCPYANFYIDLCQDNDIEYCVMYPDRGNLKEEYEFPTIRFDWDISRGTKIQLLEYKKFASRVIKKNEYDFIIALTTGVAVLLSDNLLKRHGQYLVDIRDYTHENNWMYYQIEKKVIKHANCVVISSPYFREFLPDRDYIDVFNAPSSIKSISSMNKKRLPPIIISYIGTIAYPEQCERLMKLVEKDHRFRFNLYGNDLNGDKIESYIRKNRLKNSKYYGPYLPERKPEIVQNADILFNAYGNNSPLLKYALSNKLTDAAMYLKVVLNSPDTCMDKILGVGSFPIDLEKAKNLDDLYNWYIKLDPSRIQIHLQTIMDRIINTNQNAINRIVDVLQKCK